MRALLAILALVAALPAAAQVRDPGQERLDQGLVPGTQLATPAEIEAIFRAVCMDTAPSFRDATRAMIDNEMPYRAATGTRYHERLNLSIRIVGSGGRRGCSMVVSTGAPPLTVLSIAAKLDFELSRPGMRIGARQDENRLYRFLLVVE